MLDTFYSGISTLADPWTLLAIGFGTLLGIVVGVLPGLTPAMAIALLLPITFGMEPVMSIGMLLGVLCGSCAGGAVPAILLNIPGSPSAMASTFDGHPMARKGEAGRALGIAIVASFCGGVFSFLVLSLFSPLVANFALRFGPVEYFSLSVFGLVIIASIAGKSLLKGLVAGLIGLLVATVGMDPITGVTRFTFGELSLLTGVNLLPALIGLFALSQVLKDGLDYVLFGEQKMKAGRLDSAVPRWGETLRHYRALIAGLGTGSVIGPVPGAGGSIACMMAYDQAKRLSRTPERFGQGNPEGVIATESSNNAMVGGALIPTLALGIPGEAATAVLLGGLLIQGIAPGPALFTDPGGVVYGIFGAYLIANLFMLVIMCLFIRAFVRVLDIPRKLLMAIIATFCFIGVYGIGNDTFDIWLMLGFGVLGYFLNRFGFGVAPVVLGLILGPIAEANLRRSLLISEGDWSPFVTSPISLGLLLIALVSVLLAVRRSGNQR